jgi:hypothetical protein
MQKSTWAKIAGWGQLAVEYINQVLQANGGLLPTNKIGWLRLLGSLLLAGGIHHASNTSVAHPNG